MMTLLHYPQDLLLAVPEGFLLAKGGQDFL